MSKEHLYKANRLNLELLEDERCVEGNLLISDDDYYIIPDFGVSCVEKLNNHVCDRMITLHAFEVDYETVCRYTGYTDPRKTKAFEHDIIFYEKDQSYGEIVFENGQFLIKWDAPHLRKDIHFWFTERTVYVAGNIFENADLLQN